MKTRYLSGLMIIIMKIKNRIFYHNRFTEWTCRILLSLNILVPGFLFGDIDHFYPLDVLLYTLIAFWLYLYKLHVFAIIILVLMAFINYLHIVL